MTPQLSYSPLQTAVLLLLRYLIGWHILYEGIAKAINPQWSSLGFLQQSQGILSEFAQWLISHPTLLSSVDFLNTWGLILIGLSLILGILVKPASLIGSGLIFVYYLHAVPLVGVESALSLEGSDLIVNKTLIESAALSVLAFFPTSEVFGFDGLIAKLRTSKRQKK